MTVFQITFDGHEERLSDPSEIMRRIQEIAVEQQERQGIPCGVDLLRPKNDQPIEDPTSVDRLSIGVGNGDWLLFYYSADGSALASLGDEDALGRVMFYFGDWTSLSCKYLVPKDAALAALRSWIETGELGDTVRWTTELL